MFGNLTNKVHPAGIAVIAVLDYGNVNIDDISFLKNFTVRRNAVAYDLVDRCADRFWETFVIQWRGNSLLLFDDMFVADSIEFGCGHAGNDMRLNHFEYFSGKLASDAHLFNFLRGFDGYTHGKIRNFRRRYCSDYAVGNHSLMSAWSC